MEAANGCPAAAEVRPPQESSQTRPGPGWPIVRLAQYPSRVLNVKIRTRLGLGEHVELVHFGGYSLEGPCGVVKA